jgi:apolipoprotein N-acyltransferase
MSSAEAARRGVPASVLSGILLALAYPRADLGAVAFVALVPFLLALRNCGRRAGLVRGYACGLAFFTALLYWIPRVMVVHGGLHRAAAIPILALLVAYLATYVALFAVAVGVAWRRFGPLSLLAAPVLWVGLELVRGRALTGFPWGLLGYSQYRDLPLLQASTLGGIYAVSFLVMAANTGLTLLLIRPVRGGLRVAGAALLAIVVLAHAGGWLALRDAAPAGEGGFVGAAVQANVPQDQKWAPGAEARVIQSLARLTREAAATGARLVVWPESSSPYSFRRPVRSPGSDGTALAIEPYEPYVDFVAGLTRDLGVTVIAGSVDYGFAAPGAGPRELRAFNSAFVVGPDGALGPAYAKVHLVPFGEYVPLQRILFFVDRMVRGAIAGFAPGTRLEPLPTPVGGAGTFICYEAIFPELVREIARRPGSAILVNITNDAWFGRSAAAYQHLAMAAVRAAENRRYLLRAANTGISALVDPWGRIVARTRLDESVVLSGRLTARAGLTPYARGGDRFAWACAILTVLHAALCAAFAYREPLPGVTP